MKVSLVDLPQHETILLYGENKSGKTFAYMSAIEKCINAGHRVFLINTDNGVKRTMMDYFGDKFSEAASKVDYYLVRHIDEVPEICKEILKEVGQKDLIVVDLFSRFWEMAQEKFVENISGGDVANYIEKASREKQKFGILDGQKWMYVKKLDSYFISKIVETPPCKVICVAAAKSIEHDKMRGNKKVMDRYNNIEAKPAGQPECPYSFNTIVYIGELSNKKYFVVIGDRGKWTTYQRRNFGRNWWDAFMEYRKEKGRQS